MNSAWKSAQPRKVSQRQMPFSVKPGTLVSSLLTYKQNDNAHEDQIMRVILAKLTYMVKDKCSILGLMADYLNSDLLKHIQALSGEDVKRAKCIYFHINNFEYLLDIDKIDEAPLLTLEKFAECITSNRLPDMEHLMAILDNLSTSKIRPGIPNNKRDQDYWESLVLYMILWLEFASKIQNLDSDFMKLFRRVAIEQRVVFNKPSIRRAIYPEDNLVLPSTNSREDIDSTKRDEMQRPRQ